MPTWKSHPPSVIEARVRNAYACSSLEMITEARENLQVLFDEYTTRLRVLDTLIEEKKAGLNDLRRTGNI